MPEDALHLLLVEDNPGDAILVREKLNDALDAHETAHVARLEDALAGLQARRYDAILLDLSLPDSTGMDTLRRTRQAAPDTPIVVLTGLDDAMFATAALREGAGDYIVKSHADSAALGRAIYAAIERQQLMLDLDARMDAPDALRFRKFIETLDAGVVVIGEEDQVVYANRKAEQVLGRLRFLKGRSLVAEWPATMEVRRVAGEWDGKPATCLLVMDATT